MEINFDTHIHFRTITTVLNRKFIWKNYTLKREILRVQLHSLNFRNPQNNRRYQGASDECDKCLHLRQLIEIF